MVPAITTVVTRGFEPGAHALLNSLVLEGFDDNLIVFYDNVDVGWRNRWRTGYSSIQWIPAQSLPLPCFRWAWQWKQMVPEFVLRHKLGSPILMVDADIVFLQTNWIQDWWDLAAEGHYVAAADRIDGHRCVEGIRLLCPHIPAEKIVLPELNSGLVAMDPQKHPDFCALFCATSQFADYTDDGAPLNLWGYGDQAFFNGLIHHLDEVGDVVHFPSMEWHNCDGRDQVYTRIDPELGIVNSLTGRPQKILHDVGWPKWWTLQDQTPPALKNHRAFREALVHFQAFLDYPVPWQEEVVQTG